MTHTYARYVTRGVTYNNYTISNILQIQKYGQMIPPSSLHTGTYIVQPVPQREITKGVCEIKTSTKCAISSLPSRERAKVDNIWLTWPHMTVCTVCLYYSCWHQELPCNATTAEGSCLAGMSYQNIQAKYWRGSHLWDTHLTRRQDKGQLGIIVALTWILMEFKLIYFTCSNV